MKKKSGREELPEGVEPERLRLQEEGEVVKKIVDPMLPTEQEVKEHYEIGRDGGKERKLPDDVWDYCFPGDEFGHTWTVF
eukprot:8628423-Karenia_brevis.AAC.1